MIWNKLDADGSIDLFVDYPNYLENGLLEIIALGEPELFTFEEFVASFEDNPEIISQAEFVTDAGAIGAGGIFKHGDPDLLLIHTGFLGFQTDGHSYYFIFTTTADSLDQLDINLASALKSVTFLP